MIFKKIYWTIKHLCATIKHKWYVLVAGKSVLPKKHRVSLYRLAIHDFTKFLPVESVHYGRHFFGDKKTPDKFYRAWLYHANHNPHHWQYWILQQDRVMEMPKKFVREMVADWLGAER